MNEEKSCTITYNFKKISCRVTYNYRIYGKITTRKSTQILYNHSPKINKKGNIYQLS